MSPQEWLEKNATTISTVLLLLQYSEYYHAAMSEAGKWIDVKERLPIAEKEWDEVFECDMQAISWPVIVYDEDDNEVFVKNYPFIGDHSITHWQPLPEPPK